MHRRLFTNKIKLEKSENWPNVLLMEPPPDALITISLPELTYTDDMTTTGMCRVNCSGFPTLRQYLLLHCFHSNFFEILTLIEKLWLCWFRWISAPGSSFWTGQSRHWQSGSAAHLTWGPWTGSSATVLLQKDFRDHFDGNVFLKITSGQSLHQICEQLFVANLVFLSTSSALASNQVTFQEQNTQHIISELNALID